MPMTFSSSGIVIQTFDECLAEIQALFQSGISASIKTDLKSAAGQLQRILATRDLQMQEKILQLYQAMDPRLAEGVHQDMRFSLLGISREPATAAEVLGTATGTPATEIPDGFALSVGGFRFTVMDGPYTIGGGGTVTVRVRSDDLERIDVSVLGAWTLLDSLVGFTSFDDTSQPIMGREVESGAEFRVRAEIERYRRASGPLVAIEANVFAVDGVEYVRAYHNVNPATPINADGIPLHAINLVVVGGDDTEIAQAIQDSGPAGHLYHGTDVSVILGSGTYAETISFDRVTDVPIWIDGVLTTSTSEEAQLDDPEAAALEALAAYTLTAWQIGGDVLPSRLAGVLANLQGVDGAAVETSLTGGGGSYSSAKRTITIRERATYLDARTAITEA